MMICFMLLVLCSDYVYFIDGVWGGYVLVVMVLKVMVV